jgi:hypothetical protein
MVHSPGQHPEQARGSSPPLTSVGELAVAGAGGGSNAQAPASANRAARLTPEVWAGRWHNEVPVVAGREDVGFEELMAKPELPGPSLKGYRWFPEKCPDGEPRPAFVPDGLHHVRESFGMASGFLNRSSAEGGRAADMLVVMPSTTVPDCETLTYYTRNTWLRSVDGNRPSNVEYTFLLPIESVGKFAGGLEREPVPRLRALQDTAFPDALYQEGNRQKPTVDLMPTSNLLLVDAADYDQGRYAQLFRGRSNVAGEFLSQYLRYAMNPGYHAALNPRTVRLKDSPFMMFYLPSVADIREHGYDAVFMSARQDRGFGSLRVALLPEPGEDARTLSP